MDLIITILPVVTKTLPGSRFTIFYRDASSAILQLVIQWLNFYFLTFPRFPLRKKEHKSYFGKNRTHDFRTSRCAGYLLLIDHSGDERLGELQLGYSLGPRKTTKCYLVHNSSNYFLSQSLVRIYIRHVPRQWNIHFPCSADHEQDWQPYPVDPYSATCGDVTYILRT